jgi:hypothetical protein
MNIFKIFHFPKTWQNLLILFFDVINPLLLIFLSFFINLLPIQSFFPSQGTPDIPIIILFCLLLNKYALYFIPIFFLSVMFFEYCFMIPMGTLVIHYVFFLLIGYFSWGTRLDNDISFRLVYFYFIVTYAVTLIFDICIYSFILQGYLNLYEAFSFLISNIIIFPVIFHIAYYMTLQSKSST